MKLFSTVSLASLALALSSATLSFAASDGEIVGRDPKMPPPSTSFIPTVKVAKAVGWKNGAMPVAGAGLAVKRFADGLDHPRWLHVLPNGDVLVAESNAPKKTIAPSWKDWFAGLLMSKAGAGVASANRISLLRDADGDGIAEIKTAFIEGLNSPFGMALVGSTLYVANADAIVQFPYADGATQITEAGAKVVDLPGGPRNHHWTKNIIASRDGRKLFVTVGSNSNIAENGMDEEVQRAAILEVTLATKAVRVFASGLRNPNGLAWKPSTDELWTVVNERDELGDNLVPDYLTSVKDNGFYGWPYSYFGQIVDTRVTPQNPELVAKAIKPDYALGAHTASLGLTFADGAALGDGLQSGAFIGQHGSWNRSTPAGYKVIFVPFADGIPDGTPKTVLSGFLDADGNASGRPVGVVVDKRGALLVADDVGNVIWQVTSATQKTSSR
ncbi:MAG: PQQ-dependent sugar dehydrogenase [Hyphomicrobium sp.]